MIKVRSPAFRPQASDANPFRDAKRFRLKAGLRNASPRRINVNRPNQRAPINRQNRSYDRTVQSGPGADDADSRAARDRRLRRTDRRIYESSAMAHRSHVMVFRDATSDMPPRLSHV